MILTVCERGNVRSVTLATILKDQYMIDDVIPVGVKTTSPELFTTLAGWAETIFQVGTIHGVEKLPLSYVDEQKLIHLDIGLDGWRTAMHPELVTKLLDTLWALPGWAEKPTRLGYDHYLVAVKQAYAGRQL